MVSRLLMTVALLVGGLLSTGCSTYAATRYASSADNLTALRPLKGQALNVGEFKSAGEARNEIMCRARGPIKTPDGESFATYVRRALIAELQYADVYSTGAPVTLSGTLDEVDFSSTAGAWELALTVKSSNGRSLSVSQKYGFTPSISAETSCEQAAQALMPAVQDLIKQLVSHAEFGALTQASEGAAPSAGR